MPQAAEPSPTAANAGRGARFGGSPKRHPLRTFLLWVAVPAAAVFAAVCSLVFLIMYLMSAEMNAIDADRGRKAIVAAIESLVVALGEGTADEATWTEAYVNTYITPNPAWFDSVWGATARISESYDTVVLTDTAGQIVFGETSRGPIGGQLADHFSSAATMLAELDQNINSLGDDATVAHLVRRDDGAAALAAAVVHGNTGQASVPRSERRILWFAKQLNDEMLSGVAARFQLPLPRFERAHEPGAESMVLHDADGAEITSISWQPRRPGDPAFAHAAGVAAILMLIIGVLVTAVLVAFFSSIKSRTESDERDWHNARYDPVTGLPNGFALEESLRNMMPRKRRDMPLAAAQIGIDGFFDVIASYGREAGDRLMDVLADHIEAATNGHVQFARTGAAEFTLARAGDDGADLVRGLAMRILGLASEAIKVDNLTLKVGLSVGFAEGVVTRETIGDLMRRAETALARARETGGHHLVVYDPGIEDERRLRLELQADIRRGLNADEFDLDYQPIIDFATQSIIGVEALMRWNRRPGGPMGPGEFIPVAEKSGLIDDLGMFALRRAIEEIGPFEDIKVSVNVSAAQLRNPNLGTTISAVLEEWGMAADRLQLEVTESFLIAQPERAKRVMEELRARGIVLALDDFGTGYSSIGYLRQFAFDRVKLDRSLVADIDQNAAQSALVEATMIYAFAMGLAVTAEGVERREEAALLARYGCREFQGYLFARPMPVDQLARLLSGPAEARKAG
ncbi:putative bifunctional diguanylate cyclase/phosphodiesterase [Devosia sp.]|uniref:putative bifunctional diguanylate cyclase/phosphodiesterase n=1 Tax=Devosia sp. TaxID=1871048 RepID=UPI0035AF4B47